MSANPIVSAPAGFVPQHAIAFGASGSVTTPVDTGHPLPVIAAVGAASSTPLTGSTASAATVGPFAPQLGRAIWLTLSGSWSGQAALLRSIDGGATKLPLTGGGLPWASYSGNVQEAVAEEGDAAASYYLQLAPSSGTITYRLAQ